VAGADQGIFLNMNVPGALLYYAKKTYHQIPLSKRAKKLIGITYSHARSYARQVYREVIRSSTLGVTPYLDELPNVKHLNFQLLSDLSTQPRLNVILPSLSMRHMSGGPNTVINLVYRMASQGVPVRFIGTDAPMDRELDALLAHMMNLTGIRESFDHVQFACGYYRRRPVYIGENDVFMATAWWTAQAVHRGMRLTKPKKFMYVIQDFEPGLHHWGTEYALAQETYDFDFVAVINSQQLADYLCENRIGRFRDSEFMRTCKVLQIAVDQKFFYCEKEAMNGRKKRLLFYARPTVAKRNLYELGIAALYQANQEDLFDPDEWEMTFMGEKLPSVDLGKGLIVRSAPWLEFGAYAELMRHSDIVLSLMFSPHPSYPPLEAAACGSIAVTNHFATKTEANLRKISENIVPVDMTIESIVEGLKTAKERVLNQEARLKHSQVKLSRSWDNSFKDILPQSMDMWNECLKSS
jgi:O-antigen biosynthesis protein